GIATPLQFALERAEIQVRTVSGGMLEGGYAYLRIATFSDTTAGEVARVIAELKSQSDRPWRGAVLDLRNNPGGVLDAAVDVADLFLHSGLIVRGTGRAEQSRFARYARPGDLLD